MNQPLLETTITSLKRIHQGKVRDIYDIDAETMLLVSTDRLSAFDVILPTGIANKRRDANANGQLRLIN